jgi:hypothetical protein
VGTCPISIVHGWTLHPFALTTFSTSSRRALQGPKARRHHRAGRLPAAPLRCALGASLGLARTCQQGAGSKTAQLAVNARHRCQCTTRRNGRPSLRAGCPLHRLDRGFPHRPASNHGRDGPARHASRAPPASLRDLRPLTRTAPNLRSAAIGAMREDCPRA